jgi:hypothetical protein
MADVGHGLQAALLLAWGRREGMVRLAAVDASDARVAARSFWAAALCVPAFVCIHLIGWVEVGVPAHPAAFFIFDLMGHSIAWAGFAVLSHAIAAAIGRSERWPRFIAVWNWCNVVQYLMMLVSALPLLIGVPSWISEAVWLVAIGWALWLEWFATRLALEVGPYQAAALTGCDLMLGLFLSGLTAFTN